MKGSKAFSGPERRYSVLCKPKGSRSSGNFQVNKLCKGESEIEIETEEKEEEEEEKIEREADAVLCRAAGG